MSKTASASLSKLVPRKPAQKWWTLLAAACYSSISNHGSGQSSSCMSWVLWTSMTPAARRGRSYARRPARSNVRKDVSIYAPDRWPGRTPEYTRANLQKERQDSSRYATVPSAVTLLCKYLLNIYIYIFIKHTSILYICSMFLYSYNTMCA